MARHPSKPHLLHPHLRQPKLGKYSLLLISSYECNNRGGGYWNHIARYCDTTVRPHGNTDRENVFELILHLIADIDTAENYLDLFVTDADTAVLCSLEGGSVADNFFFRALF